MFIELTEYLRCPADHEVAHLVLATGAMTERAIRYGTLGCPVCHAEFLIVKQVAKFGAPPARSTAPYELPAPDDVWGVLGLESPGGYVVLVGSATHLAGDLAQRMPNVHFVCVNAPDKVGPARTRSLLEVPSMIPLRARVARGVVLGGEYVDLDWMAEAARVTLNGQRVVVLAETAPETSGLEPMASGKGMWVGART